MELLEGTDLGHHLAARRPSGLSIAEAAEILLAVCSGIVAAHQLRIVHRDIKPTNVFLARNALHEVVPKVLDFGVAKVDDHVPSPTQTERGALVGTPQYMAPEQIKGAPADARSDQYALGVLLFECLTGRNPYQGSTPFEVMSNIAAGRATPLSAIRSDIPADLTAVIGRAMRNDPADRYTSVLEFGRVLLPFAAALPRAKWAKFFQETQSPFSAPGSTLPLPRGLAAAVAGGAPSSATSGSFANESWYVNSSTAYSSPALSTERISGRRTRQRIVAGAVVSAAALGIAAIAIIYRPLGGANDAPSQLAPVSPARVSGSRTPDPASKPPLLQPTPREVSINVASEPAGAEIWLEGDGEMKGRTPAALRMPLSREPQTIVLRLAGHQERSLVVTPDGDRAPDVVRLVKERKPSRTVVRPTPHRSGPAPTPKPEFTRMPD